MRIHKIKCHKDLLYSSKVKNLQLPLTNEDISLHKTYCSKGLESIYGAGCINNPDSMLLFMNPTARNISAATSWKGIRAPWLGIQKTWKLLSALNLIEEDLIKDMYSLQPSVWDEQVAEKLYRHVAAQKLYITNLAKCTQPDARPLSNSIFRAYLPETCNEIKKVNPKKIITFGNQVSSILLGKPISVSQYTATEFEILTIGREEYNVYPTYYPVGQGQRNMLKAIQRIQKILNSKTKG